VSKRPKTIAEYIEAAPAERRPHMRKLHAIVRSAAPKAEEAIKWSSPFFVEPRFVFAFSAHKAHLSVALTPETTAALRKDLAKHPTTKGTLQIPYDQPVPTALVRKIVKHRLKVLRERKNDTFW
jgi:uncharacterized protein YdhG (YjbR/CyaY superfamily)